MKIFEMDNKGVSPVVGTILLIAITVVLAGTIGYFATQQSPGDAAPSVSLSVEQDGAEVNLYHNGGDTIADQALDIKYNQTTGGETTAESVDTGELSAGDTVDLNATTNGVGGIGTGELTIIHNPTDSVLLRTDIE